MIGKPNAISLLTPRLTFCNSMGDYSYCIGNRPSLKVLLLLWRTLQSVAALTTAKLLYLVFMCFLRGDYVSLVTKSLSNYCD